MQRTEDYCSGGQNYFCGETIELMLILSKISQSQW